LKNSALEKPKSLSTSGEKRRCDATNGRQDKRRGGFWGGGNSEKVPCLEGGGESGETNPGGAGGTRGSASRERRKISRTRVKTRVNERGKNKQRGERHGERRVTLVELEEELATNIERHGKEQTECLYSKSPTALHNMGVKVMGQGWKEVLHRMHGGQEEAQEGGVGGGGWGLRKKRKSWGPPAQTYPEFEGRSQQYSREKKRSARFIQKRKNAWKAV